MAIDLLLCLRVAELMRFAPVKESCREVCTTTVNANKAEAVLFTRKYKTNHDSELNFFGKHVKVSKDAKYLGFVLDSKPFWNRKLENECGNC